MKKILNAFSVLLFIGILVFLWDSWNRSRIDDKIEKNFKIELLNEIKIHETEPNIRERLLKTVFANLNLNDPQNIFFQSSIEELSGHSVIAIGRFASPQTGYKCVRLIFLKNGNNLALDKGNSSYSDHRVNCFDDMELLARATMPFSGGCTADQITIETQNWISATQLRIEGYIVKESIYQYALTVFRDNFQLKTRDVSVKKLLF